MKNEARRTRSAGAGQIGQVRQIRQTTRGFALIEAIGVLTVIAILAAFALPALIREIDQAVSQKEDATLQSMSDALQHSILRTGYIPGAGDWYLSIADETGLSSNNILANSRNVPRVFLIDPAIEIGDNTGGLPYAQTNFALGSVVTNNYGVIPPVNARALLLSSLDPAHPLPSGLSAISAGDFSNIWNADYGAVPTSVAPFSSWGGSGVDLKIQRVNFSPLFVDLALGPYASSQVGAYSINAGPTNAVSGNLEGYFLQNSVLTLYSGSGVDSQQILTRDGSFVYEGDVWKGSIQGGGFLNGLDIAGIVAAYLAAPYNPNSATQPPGPNAQQVLVVNDMMAYMQYYIDWAQASFNKSDPSYQNALTAQTKMVNDVIGQYEKPNYYPPETPCP
jgi:type II secretory pathway pseudopilin PulG